MSFLTLGSMFSDPNYVPSCGGEPKPPPAEEGELEVPHYWVCASGQWEWMSEDQRARYEEELALEEREKLKSRCAGSGGVYRDGRCLVDEVEGHQPDPSVPYAEPVGPSAASLEERRLAIEEARFRREELERQVNALRSERRRRDFDRGLTTRRPSLRLPEPDYVPEPDPVRAIRLPRDDTKTGLLALAAGVIWMLI
jgi:hypothetical protein